MKFIFLALFITHIYAQKIVSIGGSITETVVALGGAKSLVGTDTSSTYPQDILDTLPKVGYIRSLSLEGTLSLKPTMIILSKKAGPKNVINQLKRLNVKVVEVPESNSIEGVKQKITIVAKAMQKDATKLIQAIDLGMSTLNAKLQKIPESKKPSVLFLFARGGSTMLVAGKGTSAYEAIKLSGGVNAFDNFTGYKPLNPEALAKTKIDIILAPNFVLRKLGGKQGLIKTKALSQTNAVKNNAIYGIDPLKTLGFGPRTIEGLGDLACYFHKICAPK